MDSSLNAARVLMGDSLGFHIIFVLFGLTLPLLVSWFEWLSIRRKDQKLREVAKFWSRIMSLLVITGVISGTVIALQMSLVWPGILKFGGEVIGLPFMFETYAFLIEAVFLALYMSTWNNKKVSARMHWVFGLFVALGSTLSAFAITSVNGWMNLPVGFDIIDGKFANVDVAKAMFSTTTLVEFFHSMPGYYLAASLTIAGLYAIRLLLSRSKDSAKHKMDWFIIQRLMTFAAVALVFSLITADITGKYLAKYEPVKLAAIELHYETKANAPLIIGGVPGDNNSIAGPYFEIPNALSILAGNSSDYVVKGLNEVPQNERPPLYVHVLFDIKLFIVSALALGIAIYTFLRIRRSPLTHHRLTLLAISMSGVLTIVVIELGWMLTEIGRQPWAVRGYLTTAEALTKTHDITTFGYLFPIAYVVLFAVTVLGLRRLIQTEKSRKGGTL